MDIDHHPHSSTTPEPAPQTVVLGRLVELWSLLDMASRSYVARARGVFGPARLLLWSLAHRRERQAARLMAVLVRPEWAGQLGHRDPEAYLQSWRADPPADEPPPNPFLALQRTDETETIIAERCGKLMGLTAHTLVEHVLRWQLADTRFAQHQIEVLRGLVGHR